MASTGSITLARRALTVLRELRNDTTADADVLATWPGWGPLAPAFDPQPEGAWAEIADEIAELLDADALTDARECVDNSFYTPPAVTDALYGILAAAGITSGRFLEPGCGSGAIIARCPADWDVDFVGVERDATSARIARAVNPRATILHQPMEKADTGRGFDAVIGNVPFASSRVYDPTHPRGGAALHNYFIWRGIDSLREGGYLAVVTSRHTMDSGEISHLTDGVADFIGAVRLPSGAFRAEGTDAVTDVVVLRKNSARLQPRRRVPSSSATFVIEGPDALSGVDVHPYFRDFPQHIAGRMQATGYTRIPLVVASDDKDADIAAAFADLTRHHVLPTFSDAIEPLSPDTEIVDTCGRKEGSFHLVDGAVMRVESGNLTPVKRNAELAALVELRDGATELLALEADLDTPDAAIDPIREKVRNDYLAYRATYGPINRGTLVEGRIDPDTDLPTLSWKRPTMGGFRRDPDYITVLALEQYDDTTATAEPAPILLHRVNRRPERIQRVTNAGEALAVSLGESGRIDLARIAELLGLAADPDPDAAATAALGDLVYADPQHAGRLTPARDYLAGNVRDKLAAARAAALHDASYTRNVAALGTVMPADLGPLEISVSIGVPWIDPEDIRTFMLETFGSGPRVEHCAVTGSWDVDHRYSNAAPITKTTYGTSALNAFQLVAIALNGKTPVVFDIDRRSGKKVRNAEQTLAAQEKLTAIQDRFAVWIWEDPQRAERICADYNRRFNSHVVRRADGSHLTMPGLADGVTLWKWQRDIVDQIVSSPATLCGHAVGGGKTLSMVAAAMTARHFGVANKPVITVPNHLLEQIAREARQAFPTGRFLIATKDDVAGDARRLFAARCATGDWDAVIMTHQAFTSIPPHTDVEIRWVQEQKDTLDTHLRFGTGGHFGAKEIARKLRGIENQLAKLRDCVADPDAVVFEHLGIDLVIVDEAHYFKRLFIATRADGFSFGTSKRATDLMLKTSSLRRRRGGLPSLALFTGTPWTNTIAETFVWQTFLQPDALAEAGVENFDTWAATFVERQTVIEVAPDGSGFRTVTRPVKIRNVPELRTMFNRCADILPAEAMGLQRPDSTRHNIVVQQTPKQQDYVLSLVDRAENLSKKRGEKGADNMLAICGDGRRVALDPRLVGIDEDSSKVSMLAEQVARIHERTAGITLPGASSPGVLQLVLCDQGTPGVKGAQTYGRVRAAIVARTGIDASRIRWVHEAKDGNARSALFAACRDGSVSVLIGSTDKVGVGTNIQHRLAAVHHLDAPWRPSDVEQREGRALRPGNLNSRVDILRYVTEGTFDAYMWQLLQRKAQFITQMYRADTTVREIEDVGDVVLSYGEMKALATGNPLLLEQAELSSTVKRLRTLRAVDAQSIIAAAASVKDSQRYLDKIRTVRERIDEARTVIAAAAAAAAADTGTGCLAEASALARVAVGVNRRLRDSTAPSHSSHQVRWMGLGVEIAPQGGWWSREKSRSVEITITVGYRTVDVVSLPINQVRGRSDTAIKNVTEAMQVWLAGLGAEAERLDARERAALTRIEQGERLVASYRFDRADELAAAEARLRMIDSAIEEAAASKTDVRAA